MKSRKDSLLAHQILTWKLKSRVDWIQEGDANTKFFHSYASARRNSKAIWSLNDKKGNMVLEDAPLKQLGKHHFSDLFEDDRTTNISNQLKVIRLSPSDKERGCRPIPGAYNYSRSGSCS